MNITSILKLSRHALVVVLFLLLVLAGCAGTPERQPVPPEYTLKAAIW